MANEYNPDLAGLGGSWLDQLGVGQYGDAYGGGYSPPTFQGFGSNPGLGGMYAGAAPTYNPTTLGNQWLDQILGSGGGAGAYQGLGGYGGLQGLYQPYTPPNMSTYPQLQAFMAPPASTPAALQNYAYQATLPRDYQPFGTSLPQSPQQYGQSYGGQQSGQSSMAGLGQQLQQRGTGQQGGYSPSAMRQQAAGGTSGYGQQATQGYGQQAQQSYGQPYQAGASGQQYGYTGGTSSPTAAGSYSQDRMPFSLPSGGVYGQQKWLQGSTGADIFLPRNTPITAKTGGKVLYATGGSAISGGADTIAQFDDGTVARFRHVQPGLQAGQSFRPGQVIATVNDSSMDMLSRQVASQIGAPDGFQHLDLSINPPGQTMFSPQGGGGGALSAPQWLQQMGYQGRVVSKTPGPQEGMSGGGGGYGGMQMGMPGGGGSPFGGQMGFPGMQQGGFGGLGQMGLGGMQQGGFNPMSLLQGMGQGGFGGMQQSFGGLGGYGGGQFGF